MQKIGNFDIVINKCLWDMNPESIASDSDKNDFLLSVVNGFEDGNGERANSVNLYWIISLKLDCQQKIVIIFIQNHHIRL